MDTDEAIDRELGIRVREARRCAGLSQADLGAGIGVSQQQILKYERGYSQMTVRTLLKIAAVLETPAASLIPGPEAPRENSSAEQSLLLSLRSIPSQDVRQTLVAFAQSVLIAMGGESAKRRRQRSPKSSSD